MFVLWAFGDSRHASCDCWDVSKSKIGPLLWMTTSLFLDKILSCNSLSLFCTMKSRFWCSSSLCKSTPCSCVHRTANQRQPQVSSQVVYLMGYCNGTFKQRLNFPALLPPLMSLAVKPLLLGAADTSLHLVRKCWKVLRIPQKNKFQCGLERVWHWHVGTFFGYFNTKVLFKTLTPFITSTSRQLSNMRIEREHAQEIYI